MLPPPPPSWLWGGGLVCRGDAEGGRTGSHPVVHRSPRAPGTLFVLQKRGLQHLRLPGFPRTDSKPFLTFRSSLSANAMMPSKIITLAPYRVFCGVKMDVVRHRTCLQRCPIPGNLSELLVTATAHPKNAPRASH